MYSIEEDEGFVKYKPKGQRLRESASISAQYHLFAQRTKRVDDKAVPRNMNRPPAERMEPRPKPKHMSVSQRKINLASWLQGNYDIIDNASVDMLTNGIHYDDVFEWSIEKKKEFKRKYLQEMSKLEYDDDFTW